jgi:nitroreductase
MTQDYVPQKQGGKTPSTAAAFHEILENRRSIRIYDTTPLPEEVMKACLKEAILAPSSSNLQVYELYWVKDPVKKKALAQACLGQPAATTAGDLIVIAARHDLWNQNLKKLMTIMTAGGKELAPPVKKYYLKQIPMLYRKDPIGLMNLARRAIFTSMGFKKPMVRTPVNDGDHRIFGHVQAALVAQTLMLAISAHGYDSCPMGGFDEKRVKDLLGLPRSAEINMVVSAGTRKPEGLYGPRIRLDLGDLIKEV